MSDRELAAQASSDLFVMVGRLRRRLREVAGVSDLTSSQASVLSRLSKAGDLTATDLAAVEGVRPQSMAATLNGLEQHGLIERRRDPDDGRRWLITLSGAGKDRAPGVRQARIDWLAEALGETCSRAELQAVITATAAVHRVTDTR